MGLSRNKVAVSEGAAGSPPFYGEPRYRDVWQRELRVEKPKKKNIDETPEIEVVFVV